MLENKLKTTLWHRRVNQTLFGICVVDSYLLAKGCGHDTAYKTAKDFFSKLAEELIENTYEMRALRCRAERVAMNHADIIGKPYASNRCPLLEATKQLASATPTKRHKKKHPSHLDQG
jgi:hypothetical protein